jgi:hypothetical protein
MVATVGLVLISLFGCAGPSATAERPTQPDTEESSTATASPSASPSDTPLPIELEPQVTKPPPALTLVPQRVPTVAPDPITGEVPEDLLDAILADAQARTGLPRAQIIVIRAEAVTWRDGSLGCPQPGMAYTEALVPGYWVVLEIGDRQLDYHASERGSFFLCESSLPRQEPLPRGGSK